MCIRDRGKSTPQPHPKQATYGVLYPFKLKTVDTLGPFQPQALGGFRYATKFVDQTTKWKEVYFMKDKTHSVDSLALFNKGTVIPTGERIQRLRGDQGMELTNADVSTVSTPASSWSLPLRTPLSRSQRTSVRAGRL